MFKKISAYATLSRPGKRERNEDCIFPSDGNLAETSGLFLVCDGVGGNPAGESASNIVCSSMVNYMSANVSNRKCETSDIAQALEWAEDRLSDFIAQNPENKDSATTVALLHIYHANVIVAHVGDSRVYHIREGIILFQTRDHSLVNDLVSTGYITADEAKQHPRRNVITKAVSGTGSRNVADIKVISDCRAGDYFLVCSDGVLGGIDDNFIQEYFQTGLHPAYIASMIETSCEASSNDNYSAIIVLL